MPSTELTEIEASEEFSAVGVLHITVRSEVAPPARALSAKLREQIAQTRLKSIQLVNDAMLRDLQQLEESEDARPIRLFRPEALSE
jgi:hypothetical protein